MSEVRAVSELTGQLPVVYLKLRNGWCSLTMKLGSSAITVESHFLSFGFDDLIGAAARLAQGATSQCVSWNREGEAGHFIDFVQSPNGIMSVVISENAALSGSAAGYDEWSAARGTVRFDEYADALLLLEAVEKASHQLRTAVDGDGKLLEWDRPFPEEAFRELSFGLRQRRVSR